VSKEIENALAGAYSHYENGKYDVAEQWVSDILAPNPFHVKALHLGAMIASERGDHALAQARLQTAYSKQPNDPELLNTLGNIQSKQHDYTRAEMAYRMAIEAAPDMIAPRQNLAFMLSRQNLPTVALREFDTLIKMQPDNANFQIGRIYALKDCGHTQAALDALEALGEGRMAKGQAALLKAQLSMDGEAMDKLAGHARRAYLDDDAMGAKALAVAVQGLSMAGNETAALSTANDALSQERGGPNLMAAAGRALYDLGYEAEGAQALKKGLKKFQAAPEILVTQAEMALHSGDAETAHTLAFQALKSRPADMNIMPVFARAALACGKVEDAMIAAEAALKVNPNNQFWIAILATGGRLKGQDYGYYYNYDKFVRSYDLSAPAGFKDMAEFNGALSKALHELHGYKNAPLDQSLRMGTQTHKDLRFSDSPVIHSFFSLLESPISKYMDAIGQDPSHPLTRRNSGKYRINGAWSVRLTAGGHHVNHVHPQGWISSAYYVDVPDEVADEKSKNGWIGFGAPPLDIPEIAEPELLIQPKPGRLVLFPSYMWHGTLPITGDKPRLTLPFDVIPAP